MIKLQFIAVSVGMLGLGMIFSHNVGKEAEKTLKESPRTEHYKYEDLDPHHKMKVSKHQTWYGDTMVVTVDTTYFYNK